MPHGGLLPAAVSDEDVTKGVSLRSAIGLPLATLLAASVAGCGQPHEEEVQEVATAFYDAFSAQDGAEACSRLAPRTMSELEQAAGKPCQAAVLEEKVPSVAAPIEVHVFGTQAEITWDGETTFLARFQDGWKVMAAACKPVSGHPYDCTISGG